MKKHQKCKNYNLLTKEREGNKKNVLINQACLFKRNSLIEIYSKQKIFPF